MFFCLFNLAAEVKKGPHRCLTQSRALEVKIWQVTLSACSLAVTTIQAVRAWRSANQAWRSSAEGKVHAAVVELTKPFEPSKTEEEVIKRPVMETIKDRIKSWKEHATIIGGRHLSGKSVALEQALRGVRGVVEVTIENAEWKKMMYEQLNVDNVGMFKEVMRRVREKLKDFPDNLTKYPILILDIPRRTTEGLTCVFTVDLGKELT